MRPFRNLYLHVPADTSARYCDFNAYAGMDRLMPEYVSALERELRGARDRFAFEPLDTVYLGGGTPSLLPADQMGQLVAGSRCDGRC